jgi:hypothetical protein
MLRVIDGSGNSDPVLTSVFRIAVTGKPPYLVRFTGEPTTY